MARMTALDIVTIARGTLGGETTETLSDASMLRFANQAMQEECSYWRMPELITTTSVSAVDGTAAYSLAADTMYLIKVIDTTSSNELIRISRHEYDEWLLGDTTNEGTPVYYTVSGTSSGVLRISLYPIPDASYTIQVSYYKNPTELVLSPTPTSMEIHRAWDEVILNRTISMGWRYLGDLEKSSAFHTFATSSRKAAIKASIYASENMPRLGSPIGEQGML